MKEMLLCNALVCVLLAFAAQAANAVNSVDYPDEIAVGLDRPGKISLDGDWAFQTDPSDVGEKEGWSEPGRITQRTAKVPLPWALVADDLRGYFGVAWYSREDRDSTRVRSGRRIRLGFHGVGHNARIFVNGKLAGEHTGLQAPFSLDITDLARPGEKNTVTVRVFQPQSGTSIYMDTHSLLRVCGIWRSVWIEATGQDFISDLFMIPDIDNARATARVTVCVPSASASPDVQAQSGRHRSERQELRAIRHGECWPQPMVRRSPRPICPSRFPARCSGTWSTATSTRCRPR